MYILFSHLKITFNYQLNMILLFRKYTKIDFHALKKNSLYMVLHIFKTHNFCPNGNTFSFVLKIHDIKSNGIMICTHFNLCC